MIRAIQQRLGSHSKTKLLSHVLLNIWLFQKTWVSITGHKYVSRSKFSIHNAPPTYCPTDIDVDNLLDCVRTQYNTFAKMGLNESLLRNAMTLEIGPGNNLALAAVLVKKGVKTVYVADKNLLLNTELNKKILDKIGVKRAANKIKYMKGSLEALPIPSSSMDLVYSNAVLEHLYNPCKGVSEIHRVLRQGGHTFHIVDLKDHNSQNPLGFLSIPDWLWKLYYYVGSPCSYTNRLRAPHWKTLFESNGFELPFFKSTGILDDRFIEMNEFVSPFRSMDKKWLQWSGFCIHAIKKDR